MNSQEQKRCTRLMLLYKRSRWCESRPWHDDTGLEVWKVVSADIRNRIFEIVQPDIVNYVRRILRNWKKDQGNGEVQSLSWMSFYYCVEKYSNFEVPLPYFFFAYSRYFMLQHYGRKSPILLPLEELKEILTIESTAGSTLFIRMMEVQRYREFLTEKYHFIFDDAFYSLHNVDKFHLNRWNKDCGFSMETYRHLRRVFKDTILYILKNG